MICGSNEPSRSRGARMRTEASSVVERNRPLPLIGTQLLSDQGHPHQNPYMRGRTLMPQRNHGQNIARDVAYATARGDARAHTVSAQVLSGRPPPRTIRTSVRFSVDRVCGARTELAHPPRRITQHRSPQIGRRTRAPAIRVTGSAQAKPVCHTRTRMPRNHRGSVRRRYIPDPTLSPGLGHATP